MVGDLQRGHRPLPRRRWDCAPWSRTCGRPAQPSRPCGTRASWASTESGAKAIIHPEIGTLTLDCDVLIAAGSDLRVVAYTAAPGSEAAARLGLLDVIGTQAMT